MMQVLPAVDHVEETSYFVLIKLMFCKIICYSFIRTDGECGRNIWQQYPVDGVKDIIVQKGYSGRRIYNNQIESIFQGGEE